MEATHAQLGLRAEKESDRAKAWKQLIPPEVWKPPCASKAGNTITSGAKAWKQLIPPEPEVWKQLMRN